MSFTSPSALLLLPALALLALALPHLGLSRPLRAGALALAVLVLAGPLVPRRPSGTDLIVLLDRSASAGALIDQGLPEWKALLESARPSRLDTLQFIDFADEVSPVTPPETAVYSGGRSATRTRLAVEHALSSAPSERDTRILLFTDGYATEPLTGLGEKLASAGVPLHFRLVEDDVGTDFQVDSIQLPERIQGAEPFVIEIAVSSSSPLSATVPLVLERDGERLIETTVTLTRGRGSVRFTDRITLPGARRYTATITPQTDAHLENNRHEAWLEVAGGPRILLLTRYPEDDPLTPFLEAAGFAVETVASPADAHVGQLTGARAVIFHDVPAWDIPQGFLSGLEFFVRSQGGGLLMAGGKHSFGSGGYFESPLDPLLPVTMELKNEHRRLSVAMAIVMDRSGSMSATVAGGSTKMQLANEGAARAIELLGGTDLITVFAVDSSPHEIVPLQTIEPHRRRILNLTRRIESMGGGIFVYTGLHEAWKTLRTSESGTKHVILFSDAADSEEPGEYKTLLSEMATAGATVSVIGLGGKGDADAAFLEDIAKRGGGRIFYSTDAAALPNLFAQETVAVARSTFVDETTPARATGHWLQLSDRDLTWPGLVGGYNLCYLRPGSSTAYQTTDDYSAPLVAFGNFGLGRSAAITFPLAGEFSKAARTWPAYGDFLQTLARWLGGEPPPPGVALRHRTTGSTLQVDLLYKNTPAENWEQRFARFPPVLTTTAGDLTWQRLAPGRYTAVTTLTSETPLRGSIDLGLGGTTLPFGPVVLGSDPEWRFDPAAPAALRATAERSGGGQLLDLTTAWAPRDIPPASRQPLPLRLPLLYLLLAAVLADALVTRTGWKLPARKTGRTPKKDALRPAPPATTPRHQPTPNEKPAPEKPVSPPAPPRASQASRSRFQRAKRK